MRDNKTQDKFIKYLDSFTFLLSFVLVLFAIVLILNSTTNKQTNRVYYIFELESNKIKLNETFKFE